MVAYLYRYQLGTPWMTKNLQRQIVIRRELTEHCYRLCFASCFSSLGCQPWNRSFQGFNEGLQQACPSHRKERRHHPGEHQSDAHQPHLPGKQNGITWFNFSTTANNSQLALLLKNNEISVLQNEKEETLTTSVWIELVVKHLQLDFCFPTFMLISRTFFFVSNLKFLFLGVAMVWLQAKVEPAAQVRSVREHHQWTADPFQEDLAPRYRTGEQVSSRQHNVFSLLLFETTLLLILVLPATVWTGSSRLPSTAMPWCLRRAVFTGCLLPFTVAPVPLLSTTFPLTGRTAPWSSGEWSTRPDHI